MWFFELKFFFALLLGFLITLYFLPLIIRVAIKLTIVDLPDGKLKTHARATPYLGGLAIYIGFLAAIALVLPFENKMFHLFVGSTLLLCVGLIDDLVILSPLQKLIGQVVATLCYLKAGFYLKELFFYNYINIAFSALWILTVINAFNLIDVMDGLATSVAITVAATFLLIALLLGQPVVALLLVAFIGALAAFLLYNKPPAKIYLGDAGSLFIGGFLAAIPFLFGWSTWNAWGFLAPSIIVGVPLVELGWLIIIRSYKKIPFYYGSRDHFSLYLQDKGWSKQAILIFAVISSCVLSVHALLILYNYINLLTLFLLGILFLAVWFATLFVKNTSIRRF